MNILRPTGFNSYLGQEQVKHNLQIIAKSVNDNVETLPHTLLCSHPGFGKTSLLRLFVKEATGMNIKQEFIGPHITHPDDLDKFMLNHQTGDTIFIDEIHAIPRRVEEALYEAMEDFKWKGKEIAPFTIVGATTMEGLLTKALLSRFAIVETLSAYSIDELIQIIHRSSEIMNLQLDKATETEIARRSRGTPRMANQLLKRLSYYAVNHVITLVKAQEALDAIGIDSNGLDTNDLKILRSMYNDFKNNPVGLESLASVLGEDVATIELLREPYLVTSGFVARTSSGRVLTEKGKEMACKEKSK